jgi:hypothetical protein
MSQRFFSSLLYLFFLTFSIFPQSVDSANDGTLKNSPSVLQPPMIDAPALKLDLSLFNLPYQVHAAQTLEHGFFESYTHPDMDFSLNVTANVYSAFHYGMKRLKDKMGIDKTWKKIVYYGGIAAGDFFYIPCARNNQLYVDA